MNKLIILIFRFIFSVIIFSSCQKSDLEISLEPSNSIELFETFWNKMNTNYVYWDIDTTDWDAMFYKYRPLFSHLNLNNSADILKSAQYIDEMTKDLIDGHYFIKFIHPLLENYSIFPAYVKKQKLQNYHNAFLYYTIDTNYLDSNYSLGFDYSNSSNGNSLVALCGIINNKILFFSCSNFSLMKSYYSNNQNGVKETLNLFFKLLSNIPDNIKGIIIDVRGNGGGDLGDLNFFMGRFTNKPLHFGYTQTKSGNGRLDYTPWINAYINPEPNAKLVKIPIIVIADINSASLSEAVVMAIKALPNGIFVGESTWGATGPLVETNVYNAGQFEISSYLTVQTASCKFKFLDNKIYEGIGFPPDFYVPYNSMEINKGKDNQLEKAISLIE